MGNLRSIDQIIKGISDRSVQSFTLGNFAIDRFNLQRKYPIDPIILCTIYHEYAIDRLQFSKDFMIGPYFHFTGGKFTIDRIQFSKELSIDPGFHSNVIV
jgi:hypothetical protein